MEKREPSYAVGRNVNWDNYYGEQCGGFLKLKRELSHDPAIPLLGVYPNRTIIEKDTWKVRDMCNFSVDVWVE